MFITKQEYYDKIGDPEKDKERFKSALAFATDTRKFEIDLYWRRSQYFWYFVNIVFGLYAYTWNLAKDNTDYEWMPFTISVILILSTSVWQLIISGSKFWQDNWERHVDLLEDIVYGPLYKTVIISKPRNEGLFGVFNVKPYSVSKINQTMCVFLWWISTLLFFRESALIVYLYIFKSNSIINWNSLGFMTKMNFFTVGIIIILVVVFLLIYRKSYSGLGINYKKEIKKIQKGESRIYLRAVNFIDNE